jgi:hypothetical protein
MVWVAWLAAALVFASFFMKTIVPLRGLAIASNLAFIAYALLGWQEGVFDKVLPILVLHGALLPLNLWRLHELRRSIRAVRSMQLSAPDADFLTPYMQPQRVAAGQVLFRIGEPADKVYVLRAGRLRIPEFDHAVAPGELFGEVGVFNETARRTGTAVCETDCELMWVPAAKLLELFYQDQRFAFLIARRLSRYA